MRQMTDPAHEDGADTLWEPSPALVEKVGKVLGMADLFERSMVPIPRLVMVTVAAPTGRTVLKAPLDVPMRHLATSLGREVGLPFVTSVTVHGEQVPPSRSLGEIGVRAGSTIVLNGPVLNGPPAAQASDDEIDHQIGGNA